MPRVCTVCTSPHRDDINRQLATGAAAKRRIAARYGLVEASLRRHEARHLPQSMIEAARAEVSENGKDLVARVDKMVTRLEKAADECMDYGTRKDLLAVARELRPYHELYGRANGQLASDKINALFVSWGVRDEAEAQSMIRTARSGRDVSPEAFRDELLEGIRFLLAEHPEWREDVEAAARGASYAEMIVGENGASGEAHKSRNGS